MYCLRCYFLLHDPDNEYLFDRCFITLGWKLMARSENIIMYSISHIEWKYDVLIFHLIRSKGDQKGKGEKIHGIFILILLNLIYILLAPSLFFSNSGFLKNFSRIIPGSSQYNRITRKFSLQ